MGKEPVGIVQIIDPSKEETHYWGAIERNTDRRPQAHYASIRRSFGFSFTPFGKGKAPLGKRLIRNQCPALKFTSGEQTSEVNKGLRAVFPPWFLSDVHSREVPSGRRLRNQQQHNQPIQNNMKTVGIIGGAGFIGSYNTQKFLSEGYKVKVSVMDLSKKEKYAHLLQMKNAEHLEIVQLNVEEKSALPEFLKGCQIVVHGGTPFQLEVKDVKADLFDPTIKGTENFLESIQKTPGIEKVVFIASVAAYNTNFPMLPDGKTDEDQIDETDTPFMSEQGHPYAQAKFIAHQTVEKFIADHPNMDFEITSVSPVGVMGKSLSDRQDSTSTGIQYLFKNMIAPNPFIQMLYDADVLWALVDVADVAEAIFKAATTKHLHGKNYLLSGESYRVSDVSLMLNHKAPAGKPRIVYSNVLAMKDLGMEFKALEGTLNGYSPVLN
jgi:nucleoside-diphosphate-sugar epimerase